MTTIHELRRLAISRDVRLESLSPKYKETDMTRKQIIDRLALELATAQVYWSQTRQAVEEILSGDNESARSFRPHWNVARLVRDVRFAVSELATEHPDVYDPAGDWNPQDCQPNGKPHRIMDGN